MLLGKKHWEPGELTRKIINNHWERDRTHIEHIGNTPIPKKTCNPTFPLPPHPKKKWGLLSAWLAHLIGLARISIPNCVSHQFYFIFGTNESLVTNFHYFLVCLLFSFYFFLFFVGSFLIF
jgi:hypothetical protein